MKKATIAIIAVIAALFIMGICIYPAMPESMASHWNMHGEVDGYLPKFWGLFLLPAITLACLGLLMLLPKIDPMKKNIEKFRKHFDMFMLVFALFMAYIYFLTLLWHMGFRFNMGQMMAPGFAVLLFFLGAMTQHAKQNWFIGIRNPWTISSEKVWKKTHLLGGKLFKSCAIIALLALAAPDYAVWLILAPVILAVLALFLYSYIEYRNTEGIQKNRI